MQRKPYVVEFQLMRSRETSTQEARFDVQLVDRGRAGTLARSLPGTAFLDLRTQPIDGLGITGDAFIASFLRGDSGASTDGLIFGKYLLNKLLADKEVRALWNEIEARRRAKDQPLRLELLLPPEDAEFVSNIPFELLADEHGFLFYRYQYTLIRVISGLEPRTVSLSEEDTMLLAWANPVTQPRLDEKLFDDHEKSLETQGNRLGLKIKAPCKHATLPMLEKRLVEEHKTTVVSLVAHGSPRGGSLLLHQENAPDYPNDLGRSVTETELGTAFRRGNVDVALLWVCYGGKPGPQSDSLGAALLHPDKGNLAAVVAAHAAIRADGSSPMMAKLLEALPVERDLERAVSEGRTAFASSDLQWAALTYYARPEAGRSVTLEQAADSLRAPPAAPGTVEGAPEEWTHFRGREDDIARGLTALKNSRLVSVTGVAGIGKTEVAIAIARDAAKDQAFGLDRALWISLDGMRRADDVRSALVYAFGLEPKDCPTDIALATKIKNVRALVVLDNAEDAIQGDRGNTRELISTVLRVCSSLRILLTTREGLGHLRECDESVVHLRKLSMTASREVFISVAADRLTPTERESPILNEVLTWLDGHPYSIVLVARQVGSLPLATIWARLEHEGAERVESEGAYGESPGPEEDAGFRRDRLMSSLNLSFRPLYENEKLRTSAEMFLWLGYLPAGLPGVLVPLVFGERGDIDRATLLRRCLVEQSDREQRLVLLVPVRSFAQNRARALLCRFATSPIPRANAFAQGRRRARQVLSTAARRIRALVRQNMRCEVLDPLPGSDSEPIRIDVLYRSRATQFCD